MNPDEKEIYTPLDLPFDMPKEPSAYPTRQPNYRQITDGVALILAEELTMVIDEAETDLQLLAEEIAPILVSAAAVGDEEMVREVEDQILAIAEVHKIRVATAAMEAVHRIAGITLRTLSVALGGM